MNIIVFKTQSVIFTKIKMIGIINYYNKYNKIIMIKKQHILVQIIECFYINFN